MALVARCPACAHEFLYPPVAAGRMGTCPRCRQPALLAPPGPAPEGQTEAGTRMGHGPPPSIAPVPEPVPAPPPIPAIRPGALLGGRYEIAEEVGRGAFGVVYRALDTRLERKPVAIKVLLDRALTTPDAVRRFRAEARLLCQVQHAQVPAVLDLGEYAGQQFIVFAFVNGKTVREMIPEGGFEDPLAAVRVAAKLVRTLHDIYVERGILHRDVKPANMMVPAGQADGLYLMDFGLAVCHTTDEARTQEGTLMGTLWYMSPEQAGGRIRETGHQSDLYSAAAVLYHLLTGRPPFDSKWPAIVADILTSEPEPPSVHRPDIDPELDEIVLRGLCKRAEDRYANGAEFAEQLELWAARALVRGSTVTRGHPRGGAAVRGAGGRVSVRRPPIRAPAAETVEGGSTLDGPPSAHGGPQVIYVQPLPPNPRTGLKIAAAVGGLLLLAAVVFGIVQMTRPKPDSHPTPATSPPHDGMKQWKRE